MSDSIEESHWRLLFPNDYLAAAEFRGKDVTLTVKSVSRAELPLAGTNEKQMRAIMQFAETPKKLVLNKTNARTVAKLLGTLTASWVGKRITLYPTTARLGKEQVEAIRVREKLPAQKGDK